MEPPRGRSRETRRSATGSGGGQGLCAGVVAGWPLAGLYLAGIRERADFRGALSWSGRQMANLHRRRIRPTMVEEWSRTVLCGWACADRGALLRRERLIPTVKTRGAFLGAFRDAR